MKFAKNIFVKNSTNADSIDTPVDLVYLWVKKSDFFSQCEDLGFNGNDLNNWELLFSLRSINQNLPWLRKIFLLTDRKLPHWLQQNERIHIIDPKEIISTGLLSSFGLRASEIFLDKISDLSEHFLYLTGNTYVLRELDKKYFFTSDGNPKLILPSDRRRLSFDLLRCNDSLSISGLSRVRIPDANKQNIVPFLKTSLCEWRNKNEKIITELSETIKSGGGSYQEISFTLNVLAHQAGFQVGDVELSKKIKCYSLQNLKLIEKDVRANKPYIISIIDGMKAPKEDLKPFPFFLLSLFSTPSDFESTNYETINLQDSSWRTVFTSFDEKYARYFYSTLQSLKNNRGSSKWEVVILHSDLSNKTKKALSNYEDSNFKIVFYNVTPFIFALGSELNLKVRSYWSIATYFKCFIPLITTSRKDVLFIDSDVIFNKPPEELFDVDLQNKSIKLLAVLDSASPCLQPLFPDRLEQLKRIGILDPETSYFNAGVLLFKLSNIEKTWYLKELISAFNKEELPFQDQDILNVIFNSCAELTPIRFNYQQGAIISNPNYFDYLSQGLRNEWRRAQKEPVIVHFTGPKKPWNSCEGFFNFLFWRNLRNCDDYEMLLLECAAQLKKNTRVTFLEKIKMAGLWPKIDKVTKVFFPLGSERRERLKSFLSKI